MMKRILSTMVLVAMMSLSVSAWAGQALRGKTVMVNGIPVTHVTTKDRADFFEKKDVLEGLTWKKPVWAFEVYEDTLGVQYFLKKLNAGQKAEPGLHMYRTSSYAEAVGFSGIRKPTQPVFLIVAVTDRSVVDQLPRAQEGVLLAPADVKEVYVIEARAD